MSNEREEGSGTATELLMTDWAEVTLPSALTPPIQNPGVGLRVKAAPLAGLNSTKLSVE
jgi:hypothetical protein